MSVTAVIDESSRVFATEPARAHVSFRVEGSLVGTTEVDLHARRHEVKVDEPGALAGSDLGASPVEHALIALASCQAITYRFWAAKLGIELDGIEVVAEGDLDLHGFFGLDAGVRPGFTGIRLEIAPSGPETAERYRELADAVDAHCPVLDLFANPTPVERHVAVGAEAAA
jgi:uncharacterized OsmC-like protein